MKTLKLILFGVIALNVIACSKKKWTMVAFNNNTNMTTKINGHYVSGISGAEVGDVEKGASTSMKVSLQYSINDSLVWTPETSFSLKPTTDPVEEGEYLYVYIHTIYTDSTIKPDVSGSNVEVNKN